MVSLVAISYNYSGVIKKIAVKIVIFIVTVCCINKMQWIYCIPLDSEKCQD